MERGGVYRIEVRGALDERVASRVAGMRVTTRPEADGSVVLIEGRLNDQAALVGLLQALLQLDMSLVSIRLVDD